MFNENFKIVWTFYYRDLRNYRNKRETMLEIVSLMNHQKIFVWLFFLTNLTNYMTVFLFFKSTFNDVTDVYFNWRHTR